VEFSGHKSAFGGGFRFKSTKDDTYELRDMKYNPSTGAVELGLFSARQNSPDVIAADAMRMDKVLEAQRIEADRLRNLTELIRVAGTLPGANAGIVLDKFPVISGSVETPIGSGTVSVKPSTPPTTGGAMETPNDSELEQK